MISPMATAALYKLSDGSKEGNLSFLGWKRKILHEKGEIEDARKRCRSLHECKVDDCYSCAWRHLKRNRRKLTRKAYLLSTSGNVKYSPSPQGICSGDLTEASQIDMEIPGLGNSFLQNTVPGEAHTMWYACLDSSCTTYTDTTNSPYIQFDNWLYGSIEDSWFVAWSNSSWDSIIVQIMNSAWFALWENWDLLQRLALQSLQ